MANSRWAALTPAQVDLGANYDRRIAEITRCANSAPSLVPSAQPHGPDQSGPQPRTFAEAREAYRESPALQAAFESEKLFLAHWLGEQAR